MNSGDIPLSPGDSIIVVSGLPRSGTSIMMAMLQAGLAAGMQKAGLIKTTPEGTNPANIKFMLEHEAELQKMQKAWEAK